MTAKPMTPSELAEAIKGKVDRIRGLSGNPDNLDEMLKLATSLGTIVEANAEPILTALELQARVENPETVEKVARALCDYDVEDWDAEYFNQTLSGDDPDDMRKGYRFKAQAAIAALKG